MVVSIVRVSSPAARRRNETFGDHVPDLALRGAGARREITNVHDRPLSTRVMSNEYGQRMASDDCASRSQPHGRSALFRSGDDVLSSRENWSTSPGGH